MVPVSRKREFGMTSDSTPVLLSPLLARPPAPLCECLDRSQEDQAKPKIHQDTQIEPRWIAVLSRRRQMRHEQEIHPIPRHDCDQRLNKIGYARF